MTVRSVRRKAIAVSEQRVTLAGGHCDDVSVGIFWCGAGVFFKLAHNDYSLQFEMQDQAVSKSCHSKKVVAVHLEFTDRKMLNGEDGA